MRNPIPLAVAGVLLWTSAASAEVQLTINDGRVSLSAKNASVAQILAEWARVGQTRILNGERIPGTPITLELTNVPEAQALDVILRSAGGYLLAPRSTAIPSASRFDRILIVPVTSGTSASVVSPAPAAAPVPVPVPVPRFDPQPAQSNDPDPDTAPPPSGAAVAPRSPGFTTFSPAATPRPAAEPPDLDDLPPAWVVPAPIGVSRPGMIVPSPRQTPPPGTAPGSRPQ